MLCAGSAFFIFQKGVVQPVKVNGEQISLQEPCTVEQFLIQRKYPLGQVAVELNGNIVPKAQYAQVILKDEDTLEVVSFVGGG